MQRLRRLLRRRAVRHSEGVFVMEGPTLVGEALAAGAAVESLYVAPGARRLPAVTELCHRALDAGARVFDLGPGVLERVADTVTPQPVLAVVHMPQATLLSLAAPSFVVVCIDVRDPGNTGAVIRAADGAGADAVVCCDGTADAFNPKTVRASAGSVLHLPVVQGCSGEEALRALASMGLRRLAAVAHGGRSPVETDLAVPLALVLGNEAHGMPPSLGELIDGTLTISLDERAESLNVSLAAAVLCFEVRRQRSNLLGVEPAP